MRILLIDNYDSFTYNLFHYISKIRKNVEVVRNDKIDGETVLRKKYDKIVISPGPGNPDQAGNCIKIVKKVHKKIPILGVCLGHQIITAETKNKTIMGLKHKEYDIHGFQFHPESISTKVGMKLIKNFITS